METIRTSIIEQNRMPYLWQTEGKQGCSDRYLPVSTIEIIEPLQARGWEVASVQATSARDLSNKSFSKHVVRMRTGQRTSEGFPEIAIINSYDRSCPFQIAAGFFRLVCSNQLILGEFIFKEKFRHLTSHRETLDSILGSFDRIEDNFNRIVPKIEQMRAIEMTKDEQGVFVANIQKEVAKDYVQKYRHYPLDFQNRSADKGDNLWLVANRLQENLIRGNYYKQTEDGRIISARKCSNIDRMMEINNVVFGEAMKWIH